MDHEQNFRPTQSAVLTDLGPLPDVLESNSETTWRMFTELQAQDSGRFMKTQPSSLVPLGDAPSQARRILSVDEVMYEVRRYNRVCPVESQWRLLGDLLREAGAETPASLSGPEFRRTPPLAKRSRVREQVEWAAQHGLLREVFSFFTSLPEGDWVHIGD
ncbi:hypothetical protein WG902_16570 [Ramlibacter sp. PS3R-8]|uniref:hypothetical protein n=1 Tax=Ramlibacter sp. PS3R-8 TaxID=3133437 RepID=UPI00309CBB95